MVGKGDIAPGERFGHLRIEEEIGQGAFATVYRARDTLIDRVVALKVNRALSAYAHAEESERILQEAKLVGKLKSPHIVTLYQVHQLEDGGFAFEMEYVDGGSLDALLKKRDRLPPEETLRILRGMLTGLKEAHGRGVIHRDIKPANVLLGSDGSVKLTDFGLGRLATEISLSISTREGILGTPRYMAPEVAMGANPSFASDLWSVGVVIYYLVSGRLPFDDRTLPALFLAIQNAQVPPLEGGIPDQLVEVVTHCLAKRPESRPASASSLLAKLDVERPLRQAVHKYEVLAPAQPLVGRRSELASLKELLTQAAEGKGATVLLTGEAGIGKTRLMQELRGHARERGQIWIEVPVTQVGGFLRPLIRGVRNALTGGEQEADFTEVIRASRFGEATSFLRGLLRDDSARDLEEPQQTVWAIGQLLSGIAKESPFVLHIEDAHFCDADDVRLLRETSRRVSSLDALLVINHRTGDPESSELSTAGLSGLHDLSTLEWIHHVEMAPLTAEETYRLLEEQVAASRVAPEVADLIFHKSDGNPLFALEFFRHLREIGAVEEEDGVARPGPTWSEADLPRRFHDLVARRLGGLTEEDRALLDASAVDGVEFDGEAVASVLERPLLEVLRSLQRLYRSAGLFLLRPEGFRFTHAVFREVIYTELAPALRREIHRRMAMHLEGRGEGTDAARLGLHWERAGERDRAVPHLMRAAATTSGRQEVRRTIELCTRAGLVPGKIDAATALAYPDTCLGLAACLRFGGRHDEAESVYKEIMRSAHEAGDETLGIRASVHLARMRYFARGTGPEDVAALHTAADSLPDGLERGLAFLHLGKQAKLEGDLERTERWLRRADEVFIGTGNDAWHGTALDELASAALRSGRIDESEALYGESVRTSTRAGRPMNAATSELNRGLAAYERGALDGLDVRLERAVRIMALGGATDLALHARVLLSEVRYALGHLNAALQDSKAAMDALRKSNYLPGLTNACQLQAQQLAARGLLAEAATFNREASELARRRSDFEAQALVCSQETLRLCFAADLEGAAGKAREALALFGQRGGERLGRELAFTLAEAMLYGLPAEAAASADGLIPANAEGATEIARDFLKGARAFARGDGSAELLRAAAAALSRPEVGPCRALRRLVGRRLSVETALREGKEAEARSTAADAATVASEFGHVWIELSLLRIADGVRCRSRAEEVAAGCGDPQAASKIIERWG
ncbi:MAG: serine/threonine-protein kinase [Planctomycetota bacterium]